MKMINTSEIQLTQHDLVRIYSKSQQPAVQGTFLLKSDLTLYCRTSSGLAEIPLRDVERIVVVSPNR